MKSNHEVWSVNDLASFFFDIVKSDRQGLLGVSGDTGSGKSTFLAKLFHSYGSINGVGWSFDNMTWSRDEMMTWIDGEKDSEINSSTGLRDKQLPEYSGIMADELLPMFYSENRFEEDQQKAIATLNMCRDRHLIIAGAVPTFWDLTGKFRGRVGFYAYIPKRGTVWIFTKEDNPFAKDPWNTQFNEKVFRKSPNQPWKSPNYLCTVYYTDWEGDLRSQYYKIRNEKRLKSLEGFAKKKEVAEKTHKKSVIAFGRLVNQLVALDGFSELKISKYAGISHQSVASWSNIALEVYKKFEDI